MGVKFKTGVEVGKDITLDKLREPYFKALLGAAGNAPAAVAKFVTKKIARK